MPSLLGEEDGPRLSPGNSSVTDDDWNDAGQAFDFSEGSSSFSGDWQPPPPSEASASIELTGPLRDRARARAGHEKWRSVQQPKLDAAGKATALWDDGRAVSAKAPQNYLVGKVDCVAVVKRLGNCWVLKEGAPPPKPKSLAPKLAGPALGPRKRRGTRPAEAGERLPKVAQEICFADHHSGEEHLDAILGRPWVEPAQLERWRQTWEGTADTERSQAALRVKQVAMAVRTALETESVLESISRAEAQIRDAVEREGLDNEPEKCSTAAERQEAVVVIQRFLRSRMALQRYKELKRMEQDAANGDKSYRRNLAARLNEGITGNALHHSKLSHVGLPQGMEAARLCAEQEMGALQQHLGPSFERYVVKLWQTLCLLRAELTRSEPGRDLADFEASLRTCPSFLPDDERVSRQDLELAIKSRAPALSKHQLEVLVVFWDQRVDGLIPIRRVTNSIRGALSDRRRMMCDFVFDQGTLIPRAKELRLDDRRKNLEEFYASFAPYVGAAQIENIHNKYKNTEKVNCELFSKLYKRYASWLEPPARLWSERARRLELEARAKISTDKLAAQYRACLVNTAELSEPIRATVARALESLSEAKLLGKHGVPSKTARLDGDILLDRCGWHTFHAELSAGMPSDADFERVLQLANGMGDQEMWQAWSKSAERQAQKSMKSDEKAQWESRIACAEQAKLAALKASLPASAFEAYVRDLEDVLRKIRACLLSVCGANRKLEELEREFKECRGFHPHRKVNRDDFRAALTRFGVVLRREEFEVLQNQYDNTGQGYVAVDNFFYAVRQSEEKRAAKVRAAQEVRATTDNAKRLRRWQKAVARTILPEKEKEWIRYVHRSDRGKERPFWHCVVTGERTWVKPRRFKRADKHGWEVAVKRRVRWAFSQLERFRARANAVMDEQLEHLCDKVRTTLPLMQVGLQTLPKIIFSQRFSMHLTVLNLDHNELDRFPPGLALLPNLCRLSLVGNKLTTLCDQDFSAGDHPFPCLQTLQLSANKLVSLPVAIGKLRCITVLEVDGNRLCAIPHEILLGPKLKILNLENNLLRSLPDAHKCWEMQRESLTWFSVRNNQLSKIPSGIGERLTALEFLDLRDNRLDSLPESFGEGLKMLTTLHLQGNNLLTLPGSISRAAGLQVLELQHNALAQLPEEICDLEALVDLRAHNNRLNALPARIGGLASLHVMHLQSNRIKRLPASFSALSKLEECFVHQNEISELGAVAPSNLKVWKLHNNQLTRLPPTFGESVALEHLDLANNQLSNVPASFSQLKSLRYLRLDGNPLNKALAKIVSSGNYSTPDEKNIGLLIRKLLDSIRNASNLDGRIDAALQVSAEDAMREKRQFAREKLQAAKEAKLGINARLSATSTLLHGEERKLEGETEQMTRLRTSRSAVQQALTHSLKRFAEARCGSSVEITRKVFTECIHCVAALLTPQEVERLCARVFVDFDPQETGRLIFDMFVVAVEQRDTGARRGSNAIAEPRRPVAINPEMDLERSSASPVSISARSNSSSSAWRQRGQHESSDSPSNTSSRAPEARNGRYLAVARAVIQFCCVKEVEQTVGASSEGGDGGQSGQPKASKPEAQRRSEKLETAVDELQKRDDGLSRELAALRKALREAKGKVQMVDRVEKHRKSGFYAESAAKSPHARSRGPRQVSSPREAELANSRDKLLDRLRNRRRKVHALRKQLIFLNRAAKTCDDKLEDEFHALSRADKLRKRAAAKGKMSDFSEEERQVRQRRRERRQAMEEIFRTNALPDSATKKLKLGRGACMRALETYDARFTKGRLELPPREWRSFLAAAVDVIFTRFVSESVAAGTIGAHPEIDEETFKRACGELDRHFSRCDCSADSNQECKCTPGQTGTDDQPQPDSTSKSDTALPTDRFRIFVEMAGRVSTPPLAVELKSDEVTVRALKSKIAFQEAIPQSDQVLLRGNVVLNDNLTLRQCSVHQGDRVQLVVRSFPGP